MAENPLDMVEYAARVCYDSHNKTDPDKTADFVRGLIKRGHCTPLEHAYVRIHIDKMRLPEHSLMHFTSLQHPVIIHLLIEGYHVASSIVERMKTACS